MTDTISGPRKIVLTSINESNIGQTVCTFGMVESARSSGRVGTFIDLYYGFKTLKCLCPTEIVTNALEEYFSRAGLDDELDNLSIKADDTDQECTNEDKTNQDNKKDKKKKSLGVDDKKKTDVFNLTRHSTITITATIKSNVSARDLHLTPIEAHISHIRIYKIASSFPLNSTSSLFKKLHYGHLALQTPDRQLFLHARALLMRHFREFYFKNDYLEVTPPTLVKTQVEGGSTLFEFNYYGGTAYLTQSSQLYLETVVPASGKAYCIMPSYRAEKFNTTRHLSEYTHVEAEVADICFEELVDEIEMLVRNVVVGFCEDILKSHLIVNKKIESLISNKNVDNDVRGRKKGGNKVKESTNKEDKNEEFDLRKYIESILKLMEEKFNRISYKDAIATLVENNVYKDKETCSSYQYGDDISDRDEVSLCEILGNKPVFLVGFPVEHKPFYCRKATEESKLATINNKFSGCEFGELTGEVSESVDLLWPGLGEILGGSMRAENHKALVEAFKREGIDPEPYYWYTDLRKFGANRHGGYGLGFERLLKVLMNYENVNMASLYPRFPGRCEP